MNKWDPYSPAPVQRRSSPLPLVLLLLAVGIGLAFLLLPRNDAGLTDPGIAPRPVAARGSLAESERSTIELFQSTEPSVVYITSYRGSSRERRIFGSRSSSAPRPAGTGTGFIWRSDGYVVTNHHVISGGDRFTVTLHTGRTLEARKVGDARYDDLAVLKIDPPAGVELREIQVGSSSDLLVGQSVFAIGSPFGLDRTLTTGVVSGLDRELKTEEDTTIRGVIQTDCAINPGNSGGPLLDSAGRLIGVNTAIATLSGSSAGVGFAIPVDTVNEIVTQIIKRGRPVMTGLGITPFPEQWRRRIGIRGVAFTGVSEGSPAEQAGLERSIVYQDGSYRLGDVIVQVEDMPIATVADLRDALRGRRVGEQVTVRLVKGGRARSIDFSLIDVEAGSGGRRD